MNDLVKRANAECDYTPKQVLELKKCIKDPIYFIETYVKILHPKRGKVPFKMYAYQKKLIRHLQENRFSAILMSRQVGKTISIAIFLLWQASFKNDFPILIASKDNAHAIDIADRIRYAYEELPMWLKPGCKYYNKHSIAFDNNSSITTSATTEKTGRGGSYAANFLDEVSWVSHRIQSEMWSSIAPSLSTGGSFIISSTPNGDSDLYATLWRGAMAGTNEFAPFYAAWDEHPERGEEFKREMIGVIGAEKWAQEFECQFVSSDSMLLNSLTMQSLRSVPPDFSDNGFSFWGKVNSNFSYYVGVDIASGIGSDFSTIQVIEFPTLRQFAEFRSNNLNINSFYLKIRWILSYLTDPMNVEGNAQGTIEHFRKNDRLLAQASDIFKYRQQEMRTQQYQAPIPEVYWSFENNGLGQALIPLIQNDENYPEKAELITTDKQVMGVHTSQKTKLLAGLELKRLIEKTSGNIIINSDKLLFELKNLVSNNKGTFQAKSGATDDLVSALLVIMQMFKHTASYDDSMHQTVYDFGKNVNEFGEEVDDEFEPPAIVF
jgi:hypothetical protein